MADYRIAGQEMTAVERLVQLLRIMGPTYRARFSKLLLLVVVGAFAEYRYGMSDLVKDKFMHAYSVLLARSGRKPLISAATLRGAFAQLDLIEVNETEGHTHPESAANRTAAGHTMELFAATVGLEPYFVQMSAADVRKDRIGSRSYRWALDLNVPPRRDQPKDNSLRCMVNVDYYLDMEHVLTGGLQPTLLYTCQPTRVGADKGERKFTFFEDGSFYMEVHGGGSFTHYLWNYNTDNLIVRRWLGPVPYRTTVYHVDRRRVSEHDYLVLLAPVVTFDFLGSLLSLPLRGGTLTRLDPVVGVFTRLQVVTVDGTYVSTGRVGQYGSVELSVTYDNALRQMAETTQGKLTAAAAQRYVEKSGDTTTFTDARAAVADLVDYHNSRFSDHVWSRAPAIATVHSLEKYVHVYDFGISDGTKDSPGMMAFMRPLLDGAYVPNRSLGNELVCIENRVLKLRDEEAPTITAHNLQVVREFVELILPVQGLIGRVEIEEIMQRQNRPSQRHIVLQGLMGEDRPPATFQKVESYNEAKDPRNITNLGPKDKIEYAAFMYAASIPISEQPWYGFRTPLDQAKRVAAICAIAVTVNEADMARFDGRMKALGRVLAKLYLHRLFHPDLREEVDRVFGQHFNRKARTAGGFSYDTGYSVLSGSADTSSFNTLVNAAIAYTAYRSMKHSDGEYYTPVEAFARLGVYAGDDSLSPDIDPHKLVKAAKAFGQQVVSVQRKRGQAGVMFLARVYGPDVWYDDPTSCCDLPRQLGKFHLTRVTNRDKHVVLREKAYAFYLTDRNTPVFRALVAAVHRTLGFPDPDTVDWHELPWHARFEVSVQYPNDPKPWMEEYASRSIGNEVGGLDIPFLENALAQLNTKEDLAWLFDPAPVSSVGCPEFEPAPAKRPYTMNGEIVIPSTKQPFSAGVVTPTPPSKLGGKMEVDTEELDTIVKGVEALRVKPHTAKKLRPPKSTTRSRNWKRGGAKPQ